MKYLVLILVLSSSLVFAQEIQTQPPFPSEGSSVVPEVVKPEESMIEEVMTSVEPLPVDRKVEKKTAANSKEARENSTGSIMVGYQLITTWLPSKKTIGYTHIFNDKWSVEGEYSFQSIDSPIIGIDVGEITERRFVVQARRYVGNSFNFSFGPVYSTFKARLGSNILESLGQNVSSEFSAHNIGLSGGIGNRWQWNNGFTLGVDWMRINIPVVETKVEDDVLDDLTGKEDRDDVKTFIRAFNRIPTVVLFGINLGYTF